MKSFNGRLKEIMDQKGLKPAKLAEMTGIGKSSISQWLSGKYSAKQDKIYIIAQKLNVNPSWLMGADVPQALPIGATLLDKTRMVSVPLLGEIACGEPITAEQNIEKYVPTPDTDLPNGINFWLTCKGDSMLPTLHDGAQVLIHEQPEVENGEIAAVLIDNEATLKRVKKSKDGHILLLPDNQEYDAIVLDGSKDAKVLGKAIEVKMKL